MQKVFGIGFHKTGTTTLKQALSILGYKVTGPNLDFVTDLKQNNYSRILKHAKEYDAFQDNPWPSVYKKLDDNFPTSKFILTIRENNKWIRSISNFFGNKNSEMREWIYGVGHPKGNEEDYLRIYSQHNLEVIDYFHSRPDDLLVIDFTKGKCWEKICRFLDMGIPEKPFPHAKRTTYSKKERLLWIIKDFILKFKIRKY